MKKQCRIGVTVEDNKGHNLSSHINIYYTPNYLEEMYAVILYYVLAKSIRHPRLFIDFNWLWNVQFLLFFYSAFGPEANVINRFPLIMQEYFRAFVAIDHSSKCRHTQYCRDASSSSGRNSLFNFCSFSVIPNLRIHFFPHKQSSINANYWKSFEFSINWIFCLLADSSVFHQWVQNYGFSEKKKSFLNSFYFAKNKK